MSEEIIRELEVLLKKATLSSFIVTDCGDRKTIYQKSKKLSFDERAKLSIGIATNPGTILYDAAGLFEATIRIDDKHSRASKKCPLAYIEFCDGYNSRVEVIDILQSVRNDATLIGHPVIVFAIHHWQKILAWEKYSKNDGAYSDDKIKKIVNYSTSGKYIESARNNLEAIGKALLEGARRQTVPKESAFSRKIINLGVEKQNTYLYVAWQRLHKKHNKPLNELEERIIAIEFYLQQLSKYQSADFFSEMPEEFQKHERMSSTITTEMVIDFLRIGGSKFVYNEETSNSQRPSWKIFHTAFTGWLFNKRQTTVGEYKKIAKKQQIDGSPYKASFLGSPPARRLFTLLRETLITPLEQFCEPIECSAETVNSHRFAELISKTGTK